MVQRRCLRFTLFVLFGCLLFTHNSMQDLCDFTDISPLFLGVYEEESANSTIYNFTVEGDLTEIRLSVTNAVPNEGFDYFYVDGKTLTMKKQFDLDEDCDMDNFVLTITCVPIPGNTGLPQEIDVIIDIYDINDIPKKFVQNVYTTSVYEYTPVESEVYIWSSDELDDGDCKPLSSKTKFEVKQGDGYNKFYFPNTGTSTLYLKEELDYDTENGTSYNVTIIVNDDGIHNSTTQLIVNVIDYDDLNPIFSSPQYTSMIDENVKDVFLNVTPQLSAWDQDLGIDEKIYFSFVVGDNKYYQNTTDNLEINTNGNTASIKVIEAFHRESNTDDKVIVPLRVAQLNSPHTRYAYASLTLTILDINDNAPIITDVLELDLPTIDPCIGFDNGLSNKTIHVPENGNIDFICRILVCDRDFGSNSVIVYTIEDGGDGIFQIANDTGIISANQTLDHEERALYNLMVSSTNSYATDNTHYGDSINITIVIDDLNDNTPSFLKDNYSEIIPLSSKYGDVVLTVTAEDKDGGYNGEVFYQMEAYNDQDDALEFFTIGRDSGVISVTVSLSTVISIPVEIYQFYVIASDNGSPRRDNRTLVTITVLDTDFNQPIIELPNGKREYSIQMEEELSNVCEVLNISVIYNGTNDEIQYFLLDCDNNDKDTFIVTNQTVNTITICSIEELDREDINFYTLKVTALAGNISLVTPECALEDLSANEFLLYIDVLDVNDNAPFFPQQLYVTAIDDNTKYGTSVITVEATDSDIDDNAKLCYKDVEAADNQQFAVGCSTGDILASTTYTGYAGQNITIDVTASDRRGQDGSLQSVNDTEVMIHILTVYDYCIMVSTFDPGYIEENIDQLQSDFEDLSGLRMDVMGIMPKTENGLTVVDETDIWFYALNKTDYDVVPYEDVIGQVGISDTQQQSSGRRTKRAVNGTIVDYPEFQEKWNIVDIVDIANKRIKVQNKDNMGMILCLTFAVLILLGSILAIIYLIQSEKSFVKKMSSVANGDKHSTAAYDNVGYEKDEEDSTVNHKVSSSPPTSDLPVVPIIIYEEQEVSMNLLQDPEAMSEWSYDQTQQALENLPPVTAMGGQGPMTGDDNNNDGTTMLDSHSTLDANTKPLDMDTDITSDDVSISGSKIEVIVDVEEKGDFNAQPAGDNLVTSGVSVAEGQSSDGDVTESASAQPSEGVRFQLDQNKYHSVEIPVSGQTWM